MESLQWLRGWVQPDAVRREFRRLCRQNESNDTCASCQYNGIECKHLKSSYVSNVKSIAEKHILKPFILCVLVEVFLQLSFLLAGRPYIIQIYKAFGIQLDANLVAVYMTILSNAACLCLIFVISFTGKRPLFLASMVTCALFSFGLGNE